MEQVVNEVAFGKLFRVFLTAFVGLTLILIFKLTRQHKNLVKEAAELAKAQALKSAQPVQPPKKNAVAAKQKALAAEKVSSPQSTQGNSPTGVAFGEGASQLVVSTQDNGGAGLCMFAAGGGKAAAEAKAQGKLPLPEIKWDKQHIHEKKNILTLVGAPASYGSGDGSIIVATCSEGTDIKLWKAEDGRCLGTVDTNQLKNTMAMLSPDGRFLTAAAFTADVKVWELVYGKDGQVQSIDKVMQLKGHKCCNLALLHLGFERIITASKDGTIRIWNINVRYHLDEDPKCLKVFPIPLHDAKGEIMLYNRLAVSPDNKVLAATHGHLLQWLNMETGEVMDTAHNAHDGDILSLVWSSQPVPTERGKASILATASADKKVKLWFPPS